MIGEQRNCAGAIRPSPASFSKSRPTWTRGIATASRSCASARANSSATWPSSIRAPARKSASPVRTNFLATNAKTVDEAYPGDVIGLVGPRRLRHRRHADDGPENSLQGNPALHAGSLRLSAQSEHGQVQAIPHGLGPACCRKASSRCFNCAMPRSRCRCWPPSGRCNSKSCNTGWKANTARPRASKPRRGRSCAGCRRR